MGENGLEKSWRGGCPKQKVYWQIGYKGIFWVDIHFMVGNLKMRTAKRMTARSNCMKSPESWLHNLFTEG